MCPSGVTCIPTTKCVGLVQSRHHYHLIKGNLFSPLYSWKIAYLALNNKHYIMQAIDDLQGVEMAFSDLHRRYEKTKSVVEGFKKVMIVELSTNC